MQIPLQAYLDAYGVDLDPNEKQIVINGVETNYVARKDGTIISYQTDCENPIELKQMILGTPANNKYKDRYNPDKLYRAVNLMINGKEKMFHVHKLIALTFIPNDDPEHKVQINHVDGNKGNNSVDNLEWCTEKHNIQEAYRTGLMVGRKGSKHHMATITEETAFEICVLIVYSSFSLREIAELTKSTHPIVSKINKGIRWTHVSKELNLEYPLYSNRANNPTCSTTREKKIIEKYCD